VAILGGAVLSVLVALTALAGAPARAQPVDQPVAQPVQPPGAQPTPGSGYSWPLAPVPVVLRPFQPPMQPYGPGHRGADLAGAVGQPVLAAADGVVVFAGPLAGRGVVSVQHPDGLRTTYEPLTAAVAAGAAVRRGQPLGTLEPGHPSCQPAACLHWGVRRGTEYLDPLRLVSVGRVRLLPWEVEVER
jgi:murein DD-endopeptidase MepM/ murein hydrolase activator NlpD